VIDNLGKTSLMRISGGIDIDDEVSISDIEELEGIE
jgi:hypothetical protein